ncbi:hypothetical protein A1Q2_06613 [Trichosporon asahii var. asahii CBS 8904]|uniref:Uncharacterized protein n=1 Tax=Trichosporon asahii var. asahii (strain CBS 8904) TaxID=1220162 RepID=K1VQQ8_TRIAC|nr:hypothetical protein A1Q2_06613 [Trichosporon asahii var. asahii CBS 8904]
MYLQDPSPTVAEYVYVHDESTPSSLGRASGSAVSAPFEDDEVLRSSAKALAVLGLIDSRHAHSNHGHSPHVSRPQSLASDGHSESSHRGNNVHLKTASGGGLRRSDARASRSPARNRASSRPVRRTEASASAEWPTRPHSADGERATASALPPRRSSLRIPPVRRIESASGSSGVLSPAPSFSNLWGSRSSSADDEVEETWATPPPPPRRRPGLPNSSLSSFSSGQLSSNQSSRSSLDVVNRRSPAGIRSLQHVSTVASHMAEVEAADSDEILTPRSKAMSTFSSDAYDEQDAVTFDTPRRSRQPTSKGYDSPRMHALVEDGKIHDSLASLSLDEGHMSQRRARAAALAAAADPLKPRRLICEMRSRSRCRASETEADAPIDFTRSPAESARSIPLPPSPDAFRTWTWNDSDTSLPYGRKGCHSPSASVHTFGPGGMSHLRSGSVDTMASLARRGSMASAGSVYTVRDSDTVELLYGQYGQPSETWEYDEGDRPIDFTRALAYSQPTTWTRPGTPEEYEDHVPVTVNNGVTVW